MCLARSKVKEVVPLDSIRSILESASGELWREGEFRLEMVWKILCQQPGLSAEHAAPPLLVFKSFEDALGVQVCLPDALSAIPRAEQAKLRAQLTITQDDFAQAIDEMHALAAAESQRQDVSKAVRAAADSAAPAAPAAAKKANPRRKLLAAALTTVALAAMGGSLWFTLRDTSNSVDLADVAPILQLTDGKQVEASLVGAHHRPPLGDHRRRRAATHRRAAVRARAEEGRALDGAHRRAGSRARDRQRRARTGHDRGPINLLVNIR